jgi:hypothetical protein
MLIRTTDSIWKSSLETAQRRDLHSFVGASATQPYAQSTLKHSLF